MIALHPPNNLIPRRQLLFVALGLLAATATAADTALRGATETALDRYVAKADTTFAWRKVAATPGEGATSYTLELVSQSWLTPPRVGPRT